MTSRLTHSLLAGTIAAGLGASAFAAQAQSLRGSASSVSLQYAVAVEHDFTFLRTSAQVRRFVDLGLLVPVRGGPSYELSGVSFPYARPQVRTFIERLSSQYQAACGEMLVVTSLTRPASRQPRNASDESVHPAGMAVDLRVSNRSSCRLWLERTLLALEERRVIEATRERTPAHYHVAVIPSDYDRYVTALTSAAASPAASDIPEEAAVADEGGELSGPSAGEPASVEYRVRRGDSWWVLARRFGTSVDELKALNGAESDRIVAGAWILVPEGAKE